jgi:hypothetical protein
MLLGSSTVKFLVVGQIRLDLLSPDHPCGDASNQNDGSKDNNNDDCGIASLILMSVIIREGKRLELVTLSECRLSVVQVVMNA